MSDETPVRVDDLMSEVITRVRRRLVGPASGAEEEPGRPTPPEIDAAAALMQQALDRRGHLLLAPLVVDDDEDWMLRTSLRLRSHRPRVGGIIVGVKRRVLLPALRWLYDFSRDNFVRQQQVNTTLMACVETLMVEVVRLRAEIKDIRTGGSETQPVRGAQ